MIVKVLKLGQRGVESQESTCTQNTSPNFIVSTIIAILSINFQRTSSFHPNGKHKKKGRGNQQHYPTSHEKRKEMQQGDADAEAKIVAHRDNGDCGRTEGSQHREL